MHAGAGLAASLGVLRAWWLVALMIAAVVTIGALAYMDERHRSEEGLEDFGDEQAAVAEAARLAVSALGTEDPTSARVAAMLHPVEREGVRILLVPPNATFGRTLDGKPVQLPGLGDVLA